MLTIATTEGYSRMCQEVIVPADQRMNIQVSANLQ